MQPEGTRLPERLLESGANDVAESVARGPESLGVSPSTSRSIGELFTGFLIVLLVIALLRYFRWIGNKARPAKKKRKRR